jgi:hypothetical protein
MIPATTERVPRHTPEHLNQQIREQTRANVARYSQAGPAALDRRLRELDEEWDIERLLEANAASLVVLGSALGAFADRRFFILPAVVGTFLLQHAIQGWCPPVPLFRRLGVRTQSEIEEERMALKAIRGDFKHAAAGPAPARAERALRAAEA